MDERRDCHTKRSESDRERQLPCDVTYRWDLKRVQVNLLPNRSRLADRKQAYGCQRGKVGGVNYEVEINIYITMCETDKQHGPTV